MKSAIRRRAFALGFDECRFTSAVPPADAQRLETWLAQRRHGQMHWLERTAPRRMDPQTILPGAKSIICLATSYSINRSADGSSASSKLCFAQTSRPRPFGFIARYARFTDYHVVLGERLKQLTAFVNQLGGAETRSLWYVDTGPLLERGLAQRAGLGFIGKHTNLISRQFGNWILLAEIITTLELEPDAPEKNHCGKCTRCLAACPTNAITAPFQLDARRCISYLTIELKGAIPVELRPAIGNRIFGCDDCLAVCPWNRFAREGHLMKSHARAGSVEFKSAGTTCRPFSRAPVIPAVNPDEPDLIELLQLNEPAFKARFAGTPVLRAKRRGFLRNVCVALGNVGDASTLLHLQKAANDPEPLIAEHARWAITRIKARNPVVS